MYKGNLTSATNTATHCYVHCNTLQHCSTIQHSATRWDPNICETQPLGFSVVNITKNCFVLQYVAVCCSVLQCVAVCCSVLQCVAVCCSVL